MADRTFEEIHNAVSRQVLTQITRAVANGGGDPREHAPKVMKIAESVVVGAALVAIGDGAPDATLDLFIGEVKRRFVEIRAAQLVPVPEPAAT